MGLSHKPRPCLLHMEPTFKSIYELNMRKMKLNSTTKRTKIRWSENDYMHNLDLLNCVELKSVHARPTYLKVDMPNLVTCLN